MAKKHKMTIGLVVFVGAVGAIICSAIYAGKDEQKKVSLSEAAGATVKKSFPQAALGKVEMEEEGITVYEAELNQNGQEIDVTIAPDGTLVAVESEVALKDIPQAVSQAIAREAPGAEIKGIEQEIIYAVVKLEKLSSSQITYDAEVVIDGRKVDIKVAADGKILSKEEQEDEDSDEVENDNDNDDESGAEVEDDESGAEVENDADNDNGNAADQEDEGKISLDAVPAAVKATIIKEAAGGTIKEIETEKENGQIIYEAKVIIEKVEHEVKVAADGTLLAKKAEDKKAEDNNDDDDNDEDEAPEK